MTKRPENFWRRWAHRAGRLLVRAYLYPMKCLFASTREDNSLAGKARRALIRSIVADTQMMNRLLDPDSSEVFAALRADDMALLRRLLGAKDHIFFVEYLDRLDTHAFEALKAFLRKDFTVLRKTVLDDEAGPLKMLLPWRAGTEGIDAEPTFGTSECATSLRAGTEGTDAATRHRSPEDAFTAGV